jgi:hypothetical protein
MIFAAADAGFVHAASDRRVATRRAAELELG